MAVGQGLKNRCGAVGLIHQFFARNLNHRFLGLLTIEGVPMAQSEIANEGAQLLFGTTQHA